MSRWILSRSRATSGLNRATSGLLSILRSSSSSTSGRSLILGIESSCDDTGAAILDLDNGNVLGESISSQLSARFGGVIPSFAMGFHAIQLPQVVKHTLDQANLSEAEMGKHLKAIAITNRPGLRGSLSLGTNYAKYLSKKHSIPLIPIHHMEAHALTARMFEKISFPFMVFLISGGHCILAIAQDVDQFVRLGESIDNSPGQVLDRAAREMRLHSRTDLRDVSGGKAIEIVAAEGGDPEALEFKKVMPSLRDCQFSFAGLKSHLTRQYEALEKKHDLGPDGLLPNISDVCASYQYAVAQHLCQRLQRSFEFMEYRELWTPVEEDDDSESATAESSEVEEKTLVVSGGVACNQMIRKSLQKVCDNYGVKMVCPPPKYCTDNGVMIAWNGLERYRRMDDPGGLIPPEDAFEMDVFPRCPLGESMIEIVKRDKIRCKFVNILDE